jgi:hypothetical protein
MKYPLSEFLMNEKNPERWLGAAGYISSKEIFSFFNNQDSRPSNFLFQIVRGSGTTLTECTFFEIWPLQGFTSKEPRPSLIHQAKPRKQGDFQVQPWNAQRHFDAGPTGFPSNVTIGHGPWLGPWTEARRGVAFATPTPSRIGQTSRIPMESTFCI